MKAINGFKSERSVSGSYPMLPRGCYVAQIKAIKVEDVDCDQKLTLRLEITEGEYANYYTNRYNSDKERGGQFEAKYKGDFVIWSVDKAHTKRSHPDYDMSGLNNSVWAIEQSNPGYHWDWNEQGLKGKFVGINVRGGSYNGNEYTTIGKLESVDEVRRGECKVMKDMKPRGTVTATADAATGYAVTDEEVPF